jgi:hypothetical protein
VGIFIERSLTSLEDVAAYYRGRLAELLLVYLISYPLIAAAGGL